METSFLHHVSLVSTDVARATAFYRDKLGFRQIDRPPLKTKGAWLSSGSLELHLIDNPRGTFRTTAVMDTGDVHFAMRVNDFEAAMSELASRGFREDAADGDPIRLYVNRKSHVGYPQAYLLDTDLHIIEINAAKSVRE